MTPRYVSLADAVRAAVSPGDHLHFASTPSRSNAAILEVARQFAELDPRFVLSTSGFHSTAHLLAALRLGRTYLSCFFGDNWPTPRPNPLYTRLAREGADLECWSLLSYVEALRAGAAGHEWAVTRSLAGSDLGADLVRRGKLREEPVPMVKAIRPDVTFVHAPFADEEGNVLFSPPFGEGFWAALGARRGTIATVERLVSRKLAARHPEAIRIPATHLLAVCVEPFGAHPQPLYVSPTFDSEKPVGYVDDTEGYARWRKVAVEGTDLMRAAVEPSRLEAARAEASRRIPCSARRTEPPERTAQAERLAHMAARAIVRRVRARGSRSLLAGIGHAFSAARLAREALARDGIDTPIMVETGLHDVRCGDACHGFLLSHDHAAAASRLSSVEDILGALVCGEGNRCLGVIGAAQVDASGALNSLRLADGTVLVGSGGANDIASSADEVVVVATCDPVRLCRRVDHVTSPGRRVRTIATDRCIFEREGDEKWRVAEVLVEDGSTAAAALEAILAACPWDLDLSAPQFLSEQELMHKGVK